MAVKDKLKALEDKVAAQDDVVASVRTLISGLKDQLKAALDKSVNGDDVEGMESDIDALISHLDKNDQALADAVTNGTPVEDAPASGTPADSGTVLAPIDPGAATVVQGAGTNTGTVENPVVVDAPAPGEVSGQASPAQPPADVAQVNVPGTSGDTTTGNVASAGAAPNGDNIASGNPPGPSNG